MDEVVELVLKILELSCASATLLDRRSLYNCAYTLTGLRGSAWDAVRPRETLHHGDVYSISVAKMSV